MPIIRIPPKGARTIKGVRIVNLDTRPINAIVEDIGASKHERIEGEDAQGGGDKPVNDGDAR